MRGYHDMGGQPAGPIERDEHQPTLFDKRVEALLILLTRRGMLRVDENRRGLETLGADTYLNAQYSERRIQSMTNNLILKGFITIEQLTKKLAEIEARPNPLP